MAGGSTERGATDAVKVWTFEIRGAMQFTLRFQPESGILAPPLQHQGQSQRTLWKMVGTEEMAGAIERGLGLLPGVRVQRYTEEQTPEQEAERLQGPEG